LNHLRIHHRWRRSDQLVRAEPDQRRLPRVSIGSRSSSRSVGARLQSPQSHAQCGTLLRRRPAVVERIAFAATRLRLLPLDILVRHRRRRRHSRCRHHSVVRRCSVAEPLAIRSRHRPSDHVRAARHALELLLTLSLGRPDRPAVHRIADARQPTGHEVPQPTRLRDVCRVHVGEVLCQFTAASPLWLP